MVNNRGAGAIKNSSYSSALTPQEEHHAWLLGVIYHILLLIMVEVGPLAILMVFYNSKLVVLYGVFFYNSKHR